MVSHVMIGAVDLAAAKTFYDAVLGTLGIEPGREQSFQPDAFFYNGTRFGICTPINGAMATHANGGTIGFAARTRRQVDAFHAAGLAHGGICAGPPGKRPKAPGRAYAAYLRDPTGNKICCICQLRLADWEAEG